MDQCAGCVEMNQHDVVGGFVEGQDREDIGLPNSTSYNPPPQQQSPVKLPLAPIVSTPPDRNRGNAAVSSRRGIAIFSPTQTLDHHYHRHQPLKDSTPDPDPPLIPTTDHGRSNSNIPAPPPQPQEVSPPPPPPPPAAASSDSNNKCIRYRECLKNHAASMGGHVVDGCGEFMPSGDEGTAEALRCAACDCHRNFHRKEVEGELAQPSNYYPRPTPLLHTQTPPSIPPPPPALQHHPHNHSQSAFASGLTTPAMVNFGGNYSGGAAAAAADESSSEDLNKMFQSSAAPHAAMQPSFSGSKKRFRTKFSQEQKDRMQELAEKLGWRMQKQDEQQVQQFCNETGVKRQVFKVWMHNNKQAMKKRQI